MRLSRLALALCLLAGCSTVAPDALPEVAARPAASVRRPPVARPRAARPAPAPVVVPAAAPQPTEAESPGDASRSVGLATALPGPPPGSGAAPLTVGEHVRHLLGLGFWLSLAGLIFAALNLSRLRRLASAVGLGRPRPR